LLKDHNIVLAEGADEIGLALMLKELLFQNIAQHPNKGTDFGKLNIAIGLIITDVEIEMTMEFESGYLTIYPGIKNNPGLVIATDANTLMNLSNQRVKWGLPYYFDDTGKEIMNAMKTGRLKIKGMVSHFPSLLRLSRVMSVH
jgi:hypothetical protein